MAELNKIPVFPTPLIEGRQTSRDWYFFWAGLFSGIPPANIETGVVVGASPYVYSASVKGTLIVQGGTVSLIEFSRDGVTFVNVGQTSGMMQLNAADRLRITYTVVPNVTFIPT